MGSKCSPFMYGVVGLTLVTLIFHLIGFITPAWLVMKRTITEPSRHIGGHFIENDIFTRGQLEESNSNEGHEEMRKRRSASSSDHHGSGHGGGGGGGGNHGPPPHQGGGPPHHGPPHHGPPHHGQPPHSGEHHGPHSGEHHGGRPGSHGRPGGRPGHHGGHRPGDSSSSESMESDSSRMRSGSEEHSGEWFDKQMMDENKHVIDWMRMHKDEMQGAEIQTNYGLWYSRVCVSPAKARHMVPKSGHHQEKRELHDKDEKDEKGEKHEKDDKHDHPPVHCKKISTNCALYYSYIYESKEHFKKGARTIDNKSLAYSSLTEHRVVACVGLALIVIGVITTVIGYRDIQRFKCVVYASIVCLMCAAFVTSVPVSRFAQYSVHRHNEKLPRHIVDIQVPYSVISSGLSAFLALCTALISIAVLIMSNRKTKGSNWSQFENEQPEKKTQNLVFYNDQLPAKPGLYDVCDFSDIKPIEEKTMDLENEKEGEDDEF